MPNFDEPSPNSIETMLNHSLKTATDSSQPAAARTFAWIGVGFYTAAAGVQMVGKAAGLIEDRKK